MLPDENSFLARLAAEGFKLDIREPVLDAQGTIKKLKRLHVDVRRLPTTRLARLERLKEMCRVRGIEPVYYED